MNTDTVNNMDKITDERMRKFVNQTDSAMAPSWIDDKDKVTRLKLKINNLLWEELPGSVPIGSAEQIACDIFCHIRKEWEKGESETG